MDAVALLKIIALFFRGIEIIVVKPMILVAATKRGVLSRSVKRELFFRNSHTSLFRANIF